MPFTYRAVTANCGNDSIGTEASEKIANSLDDGALDFLVINAQEVDFEKTKSQLEKELSGLGYKVACVGKMPTHTKPSTQLHHKTGIATFVIYKDEFHLENVQTEVARRSQGRFDGRGYNKGGIVTNFTLKNSDDTASINFQTVSGHLDAKKMTNRNIDWLNLHKACSEDRVKNWAELLIACPDLKISGYDANTRGQLNTKTKWTTNLLRSEPDTPEVQALYRAPLGNRHFSAETTYSKGEGEDPKRPGYAKKGMLDLVGISDGSMTLNQNEIITDSTVIKVQKETSTKRDHVVVISPVQKYATPSDFDRVKGQIASRLEMVAPQLASNIRSLGQSPDNRIELTKIYNEYLSTNGFLNKAIDLHTQKLEIYNHLKNSSFIKEDTLKQLSRALFGKTDWCEGDADLVAAEQSLMQVLLNSLEYCEHDAGINSRLDLYNNLKELNNSGYLVHDAERQFCTRALKDYIDVHNRFTDTLDSLDITNPNQNELRNAGMNIKEKLDLIIDPAINPKTDRFADLRGLDKLTQIVRNCNETCTAIASGEKVKPKTLKELDGLVQEASDRVSLAWKMLAGVVSFFIRVVSKITGMDVSYLDEAENQQAFEDRVAAFKQVVHSTQPNRGAPNPSKDELSEDDSACDDSRPLL